MLELGERGHKVGDQLPLDESVAEGGLRPLRDPAEADEYEFPLHESGEPSL